jgi:hypothetical protein
LLILWELTRFAEPHSLDRKIGNDLNAYLGLRQKKGGLGEIPARGGRNLAVSVLAAAAVSASAMGAATGGSAVVRSRCALGVAVVGSRSGWAVEGRLSAAVIALRLLSAVDLLTAVVVGLCASVVLRGGVLIAGL